MPELPSPIDTASVTPSQRNLRDPPDVLPTTPESIEAMLISVKVEHRRLFAGLRTIVVDELQAFAGDLGWHLLTVLERPPKKPPSPPMPTPPSH